MTTLPNIVLVHGAWADGSGWSSVIQNLQAKGHTVTAVQLPLTSLDADVATVTGVLSNQNAPTILVGHSYGGSVITQVGPDAPNLAGLVYIAAFAPDEGESMKGLTSGDPKPVGVSAIRPDARGFLWLDPDGFVNFFAPDVDPVQARVMSAAQKPIFSGSLLGEQAFGKPSWKAFPSWYLVASDDQMIPPDAERFFAQRMGATVVEVPSSHVPMVSQPDAVTNLILTAAQAVLVTS
jgi:pimeloyl-ACP methyl ester carboxylesterase